jgi:hypothetical protein
MATETEKYGPKYQQCLAGCASLSIANLWLGTLKKEFMNDTEDGNDDGATKPV